MEWVPAWATRQTLSGPSRSGHTSPSPTSTPRPAARRTGRRLRIRPSLRHTVRRQLDALRCAEESTADTARSARACGRSARSKQRPRRERWGGGMALITLAVLRLAATGAIARTSVVSATACREPQLICTAQGVAFGPSACGLTLCTLLRDCTRSNSRQCLPLSSQGYAHAIHSGPRKRPARAKGKGQKSRVER